MRFEHHIKRPRFTQWITIRAFDALFYNRCVHLLHSHTVCVNAIVLENMVGAKTAVINRVFTQRIDEGIHMPTGLPHLLIHQNCRIHAVHVITLIDESAPP